MKDSVEQPKIDWANPPPELVEARKTSRLFEDFKFDRGTFFFDARMPRSTALT